MKLPNFSQLTTDNRTQDFRDEKRWLDTMEIHYEFIKKPFFYALTHIDDLRLPKPGEQARIRVQTQLNLMAILLKILEEHGYIDDLHIITFAFNRESLGIIEDLFLAEKIKHVFLCLASTFSVERATYYKYMRERILVYAETGRFHLVFASSHAKITLARCGENYYQLEGSMNCSTNSRAEHLLFENRKESYDFDLHFLETHLMNPNNKALEIVC